MYISPYTSQYSNNNEIYFGLRLRKKGGNWPVDLEKAFLSSPVLKEMASGSRDVVGRLSVKTVKSANLRYDIGSKLYKLIISMPRSSKIADLADNLHLYRRIALTKNYHSPEGMVQCFDDVHFSYLKSQLNI